MLRCWTFALGVSCTIAAWGQTQTCAILPESDGLHPYTACVSSKTTRALPPAVRRSLGLDLAPPLGAPRGLRRHLDPISHPASAGNALRAGRQTTRDTRKPVRDAAFSQAAQSYTAAPPDSWMLRRFVFTTNPDVPNCAVPAEADYFTSSDGTIALWFGHHARPGDVIVARWSASGSGDPHGSYKFGPYQSTGEYCSWVRFGFGSFTGDLRWDLQLNGQTVMTRFATVVGSNSPRITSAVNSLSWVAGRIAPGALVTILGDKLAPGTTKAQQVPLPPSLDGVSVTFDGTPGRIYSTSAPWSLNAASTEVRVFTRNGGSNPLTVAVSRRSPGLFANGDDAQALVYTEDGWVNGKNPLRRGQRALILASGLGTALPVPADGDAGSQDWSSVDGPLSLSIGGVRVNGASAVLATDADPDWIGIYYVSFRVPDEVPNGPDVPVYMTAGASTANRVTVHIAGDLPPATAPVLTNAVHLDGSVDHRFAPVSTIVIHGSKLNPNAPTAVRFSDGHGFTVESQALSVTSSAVAALVPPYYSAASGRFDGAPSIACSIVQTSAGRRLVSNTASIAIQAPPTGGPGIGKMSAELMYSSMRGATQVRSSLELKELATSGIYRAGNIDERADAASAAMRPVIDAIQSAATGKRVSLGEVNGRSVAIDQRSVALMDALVASWVVAFRNEDNQHQSGPVHTLDLSPAHAFALRAADTAQPQATLFGVVTKCMELNFMATLFDRQTPCPSMREIGQQIMLATAESVSDTVDQVENDLSKTLNLAAQVAPWVVPAGQAGEAVAILGRMGAVSAGLNLAGQALAFYTASSTDSDTPLRQEAVDTIRERLVPKIT
jgi:uncharacterized protein (TIGR03437 family)